MPCGKYVVCQSSHAARMKIKDMMTTIDDGSTVIRVRSVDVKVVVSCT